MTGHEHEAMGANARRDGTDATVARAWCQASDEQPPAAIDAAILAAASESPSGADSQRTAPAPPPVRTSRAFERWQPFAVAASVAALAFVLVQTLPREPQVASPAAGRPPVTSSDVAASGPAEPRLQAQRSAEEVAPVPARPAPEAPAAAVPELATSAAAESSAPRDAAQRVIPETPAENSAPMLGAAAPEPRQSDVMGRVSAADAAAAPAATAREKSRAEARPDPEAWAARITALYTAGDLDGAAANLRDFRAAYEGADDYLPPALRDWARTLE